MVVSSITSASIVGASAVFADFPGFEGPKSLCCISPNAALGRIFVCGTRANGSCTILRAYQFDVLGAIFLTDDLRLLES